MRVHRSSIAILVVLVLIVAGCDEVASPDGGSGTLPAVAFVGPTWSAISVAGQQPVPDAVPTMIFTADRVKGNGGCNTFGGGYRYDGSSGRIAFEPLAMTLMACLDNHRMVVESAFVGAVNTADHLAVDADGRLHLTGPGGEVVLTKPSGS
jgi:heat shock protein HslJ